MVAPVLMAAAVVAALSGDVDTNLEPELSDSDAEG